MSNCDHVCEHISAPSGWRSIFAADMLDVYLLQVIQIFEENGQNRIPVTIYYADVFIYIYSRVHRSGHV